MLGVQWLKTLGPIKWDFTHMSMQFAIEGNDFYLLGINTIGVNCDTELKSLKSYFLRP